VALLLTTQPLPAGERVSVVGHSTALGVLVADALATSGLPLARLVDVGVAAEPAAFGRALRAELNAADTDAVVCVFVPPIRRGEETAVAAELRNAVAGQAKPVLSTFLGFDGVPAELAVPGRQAPMPGSIPSFSSPERAVAALARVSRYARWRRREPGQLPELAGIAVETARTLLAGVLAVEPAGRRLTDAECRQLLGCYGIEVVPAERVSGPEQAVAAAGRLGWPVAIKVSGQARLHLADAEDVRAAWRSLGLLDEPSRDERSRDERSREEPEIILQAMAPRGVDTVLRVHDDRSFGALISFGVGGVATDLLADRAYAVVPLTTLDAAELISGPRAFPLLAGYGGATPADLPALVELALRLSRLADDLPEVVECGLDPVVAAGTGAAVLAADIRIAPPIARDDRGARRLRGL